MKRYNTYITENENKLLKERRQTSTKIKEGQKNDRKNITTKNNPM